MTTVAAFAGETNGASHAALFGTGKIHHSNGPPKNTLKPSKTI
jgi:hypothetical protein